ATPSAPPTATAAVARNALRVRVCVKVACCPRVDGSARDLHSEPIERDFVVVATREDAHSAMAEDVVADPRHFDAVNRKRQILTCRAHGQLVGRTALSHRWRSRPRHQVDPPIALAAPDPKLAEVACFEHVAIELLAGAVELLRLRAAHDQAVPAAWWAAGFAHRGRNDDVVGHREG